MKQPLVSVIIPNYNHSRYLDQRIQSVLNQTYSNYEIIILDDHSMDDSVQVIAKYKDEPKVAQIIVNEQNSGSTFIQWNRGFELSRGEVIWIAESDDFCDELFLETCISEYSKDDKCAVVFTSSEYVDSDGKEMGTYKQYKEPILRYNGIDFIKNRMALGCAIWNASSAIFRKQYALEVDKRYQQYKMCGDKLFWIEMAEKGPVVHINSTLNYFRQHQNKVSPRRFRDGTWLSEEYDIYLYQCRMCYLSGFKRIFVLSSYYDQIRNGEFDDEGIRNNLLKIWGMDKSCNMRFVKFCSRLYQYYRLYILHKNVI